MKNRIFRTLLCVLLVVAMVASLCACGTESQDPNTINHEDITDYCYIGQEGNSKTYNCSVTNLRGESLFSRTGLSAPPTVLAIDENVLCVYQRFGNLADNSWLVYCDVKNGGTSNTYTNILGFKGMYVAYTDYLSDAHQVFVRHAVDETIYFQCYTLADADQGKPVLGGKLNSDGHLEVTYLSGAAEKTIVVDMP